MNEKLYCELTLLSIDDDDDDDDDDDVDDDDDNDDDEYLDKKEKKKLENKRRLERMKPSFIFQLLILFLAPPLFNFQPPVCSPLLNLHAHREVGKGEVK